MVAGAESLCGSGERRRRATAHTPAQDCSCCYWLRLWDPPLSSHASQPVVGGWLGGFAVAGFKCFFKNIFIFTKQVFDYVKIYRTH